MTCGKDKEPYSASTIPVRFPLEHQRQTPFRTTTPATTATTAKQVDSVHVHILLVQNTSQSGPPAHCAHVHKPPRQVLKPGDLLTLRKVQHPHNGKTSVNRLPLMKQDILSHYSSCFEGIGCFPGDPYKFHLKPEHKPARHAPRKVPIHLEDAFKEEIKSLVELGILEEVKEHIDWVNSYVIVEKDSGNHNSPNHTIKRKLRTCLDPRDLNEALEREPYHTHSVDEITIKLQGMTVFIIVDFKKGYLDGSTSSRIQETHLYGATIWQIPMDKIAHGCSGCPGHFPIQAGFHLYWHGRCHKNC